jgi:hypothetical protein
VRDGRCPVGKATEGLDEVMGRMPSAGGSDAGDGSGFISGQTRNNKYGKGTDDAAACAVHIAAVN